jgi:hypothetical protein
VRILQFGVEEDLQKYAVFVEKILTVEWRKT